MNKKNQIKQTLVDLLSLLDTAQQFHISCDTLYKATQHYQTCVVRYGSKSYQTLAKIQRENHTSLKQRKSEMEEWKEMLNGQSLLPLDHEVHPFAHADHPDPQTYYIQEAQRR